MIAYYAGKAAADSISKYGVYGGIALAVVLVLGIVGIHVWRRRVVEEPL